MLDFRSHMLVIAIFIAGILVGSSALFFAQRKNQQSIVLPVNSSLTTSCRKDDDCVLVDTAILSDCSLAATCEPFDYSLSKWTSVNQNSWSVELDKKCPNLTRNSGSDCFSQPINDNFEAKCVKNVCQKIRL